MRAGRLVMQQLRLEPVGACSHDDIDPPVDSEQEECSVFVRNAASTKKNDIVCIGRCVMYDLTCNPQHQTQRKR